MTAFLRRTHGTLISALSIIGQRQVPYWPRERIEAARDLNVRATVAYAAATVPHYRDLFRSLGIDPTVIRSAEDLCRLPLLDKDTVRRDPLRFLSESPSGQASWKLVTSGSTGEPLAIYHDQRSTLINSGHNRREDAVVARILGKRRWRSMGLAYQGSMGDKIPELLAQVRWSRLPPNRRVTVLDPVETVVAEINRVRPDVLRAYGNYLETLFRTVQERQLSLVPLGLVLHGGDVLPVEVRHLIEKDLGIPVMSRYAAIESFKIGFTCEAEPHYHVHEDLVHVRIVGPDGRDLPRGQQGEVVISNLVNRGTVLINYRLGDLASWVDEPCSCGRTFRRLRDLDGRVEDLIWLPSGHFVHPRAVWRAIRSIPGILRFQFIQHQVSRFELRLQTVDRASFDQASKVILQDLAGLVGTDAEIVPVYLTEWPRQEPGKASAVMSLIGRQS